jgi:hypothetical protein
MINPMQSLQAENVATGRILDFVIIGNKTALQAISPSQLM